MKKSIALFVIVVALLVTSACSFGNNIARRIQVSSDSGQPLKTLTGSGNIVKEDRVVSDFNQVVLTGVGELIVEQGESEALTIEADDNILPVITSKVVNNVLEIGLEDGIRLLGTGDITYHLKLKDLSRLEISGLGQASIARLKSKTLDLGMSGSGTIKIDDLQATVVSVSSSGLGAFTAAGKVDSISLNFSGAGFFDAKNLQSASATLNINGTGTASVWATDQLDVNISGGGYVSYYGDPQVTKTISGIGKVEKAGDK